MHSIKEKYDEGLENSYWDALKAFRSVTSANIKENTLPKESITNHIVDDFFHALLPSAKSLSRGHDLDIVKQITTSILKLMEENILSKSEANALIEWLASKFVQHKFDHLFSKILDMDVKRKYSFHKITGSMQ